MILSIDQLTKSYKENVVLDDITYSISEPEIIGLVAPNGSGKTTLFDCLTGIQKSDYGEVQIFGIGNESEKIFRKISYMQDNRVLYPELTALDHLKYVAGCHDLEQQAIDQLAEKLNMTGYLKKKTRTFSLGMKQTLLLGMAVLIQPKLLLLDEPINGLDVTACNVFREIINELHSAGSTIIISSHNLEEIEKLTSKVLFLKDGALLASDDETIIRQVEENAITYEIVLDPMENMLPLIQDIPFEAVSDFKIKITLDKTGLEDFKGRCRTGNCRIYEIRPVKNLIHQIYEMLY